MGDCQWSGPHPRNCVIVQRCELAWEYFRGETLPKDIASATALLRQLELTAPEFARFNLAKIKYLEGDSTFVEDIRQDCAAGFGPALYVMGMYSRRRIGGDRGRREALEYFRTAAEHGHLPSELEFWRHSKLGALAASCDNYFCALHACSCGHLEEARYE
jgi:TPR repeat protein